MKHSQLRCKIWCFQTGHSPQCPGRNACTIAPVGSLYGAFGRDELIGAEMDDGIRYVNAPPPDVLSLHQYL